MPTSLRSTFAEMLHRLFTEKHTGPVVVHFAEGQPTAVDIVAPPVQVKLDKVPQARAFSTVK